MVSPLLIHLSAQEDEFLEIGTERMASGLQAPKGPDAYTYNGVSTTHPPLSEAEKRSPYGLPIAGQLLAAMNFDCFVVTRSPTAMQPRQWMPEPPGTLRSARSGIERFWMHLRKNLRNL